MIVLIARCQNMIVALSHPVATLHQVVFGHNCRCIQNCCGAHPHFPTVFCGASPKPLQLVLSQRHLLTSMVPKPLHSLLRYRAYVSQHVSVCIMWLQGCTSLQAVLDDRLNMLRTVQGHEHISMSAADRVVKIILLYSDSCFTFRHQLLCSLHYTRLALQRLCVSVHGTHFCRWDHCECL